MFTGLATVFYKLLLWFTALVELVSPVKAPAADQPISPAEADILAQVVLWGDPQISDYLPARQRVVRAACLDLANAAPAPDAIVLAGDLTENGKPAEYRLLLDDLTLASIVKRVIPAAGNHDVRLRDFTRTVAAFTEFCRAVDPKNPIDGKLYYIYEVNGYPFIVLGACCAEFEEAYLDDAELLWLDAQLAAAAATGKPAFVILHQPLKNTHNLPKAWNSPVSAAGSVGAQSDALRAILGKYKHVFLITGHLHSGLSNANFETVGNVISVNVPSIGIVSKDGGYEAAGTGYVMEVYPEKVLFRARDFANGRWLPTFDRAFALR